MASSLHSDPPLACLLVLLADFDYDLPEE
ncbi:MAG: hypothetical protein JWN62_1006, partial [Acidimicrobiales bacterium]|nr:hypothetical protein [Acidimicrobiales bacterium]